MVKEVDGVAMTDDDLDPEISLCGHACLSLTWLVLVVAYTVVALYAFFTRPEVDTFSQAMTSEFGPVPLRLELGCTNAPFCGNATVAANYTDHQATCGAVVPALAQEVFTGVATGATSDMVLCYTPESLYSVDTKAYFTVPGLQVDFSAINPGVLEANKTASASVRVSSPELDPRFRRLVNMESWQVKTLVVGQNVKRRDGAVISRTLFPLAIQYEGKRPNWRATFFVALSPLTNVYDTDRPGELLDVVASVGGAAGIVTAVLVLLTPLIAALLPGPAAGASAATVSTEPTF
jgi:hypothetical protein